MTSASYLLREETQPAYFWMFYSSIDPKSWVLVPLSIFAPFFSLQKLTLARLLTSRNANNLWATAWVLKLKPADRRSPAIVYRLSLPQQKYYLVVRRRCEETAGKQINGGRGGQIKTSGAGLTPYRVLFWGDSPGGLRELETRIIFRLYLFRALCLLKVRGERQVCGPVKTYPSGWRKISTEKKPR